MTEYWKTDHVRTFGQLLFIGPANSHTHTLPVHCCINGLSRLVCFSRHGFADRVKSRLRQWDPWRALDGRYGSDIHPCVGETSLKALQSCLGLWLALLGLIATPNSPVGRLYYTLYIYIFLGIVILNGIHSDHASSFVCLFYRNVCKKAHKKGHGWCIFPNSFASF